MSTKDVRFCYDSLPEPHRRSNETQKVRIDIFINQSNWLYLCGRRFYYLCLSILEPVILTAPLQQRIIYESEISVFDKQNRCNISDGDYEVNLQVVRNQHNKSYQRTVNEELPKKHSTWEELNSHDIYDAFSKLPTLKFRLSWTKDKCDAYVDRPLPITIRNDHHHQFKTNKDSHLQNGQDKTLVNAGNNNNNKTAFVKLYDIASRIIYRFIYNNHSSQQTEACDNFNCPWCNLNCVALYSLLKHLKLCHPRFNFTYVPTENSVRIDVTISDVYDCSYSGSPFDLLDSTFGRPSRPAMRTPVTTFSCAIRIGRSQRSPNFSKSTRTNAMPTVPLWPATIARTTTSPHTHRSCRKSSMSIRRTKMIPPGCRTKPSTWSTNSPMWTTAKKRWWKCGICI